MAAPPRAVKIELMRRRDRALVLLPALSALCALLVAGCGATNDDADPAPELTATATATADAGGAPDDWQSRLDADVAAAVADGTVPGFAMAHVADDGSVTTAVAGQRSHDDATPLGPDAPFHLGSDTKAMTAVLLGTFVEEGVLDLDASLSELFPEAALAEPTASVTLRDVLGHRAGLSDDLLDLAALHAAPDAAAARADAVLTALGAAGEPGTFAYSNVGYMLAGTVAERLGGAPWEQLITERVFEPLGMDCGFGAPTGPGAPLGHLADGTVIGDDDPITDNPAALGPAGTVHCPMTSWAAFATAVLDGLQGEDSPVLEADTAADLFAGDQDYVAGWSLLEEEGQHIWAHDGSNTVWYARAILLVERGEVLLLASNTGEQAAVAAMDRLTEVFVAEG